MADFGLILNPPPTPRLMPHHTDPNHELPQYMPPLDLDQTNERVMLPSDRPRAPLGNPEPFWMWMRSELDRHEREAKEEAAAAEVGRDETEVAQDDELADDDEDEVEVDGEDSVDHEMEEAGGEVATWAGDFTPANSAWRTHENIPDVELDDSETDGEVDDVDMDEEMNP
ncbi:hypothetical protein LTR78_007289 [Recurvomyces mirabilis]|uniref:Uncharacterized protein n=1 Tax=Recurvomyces mirabilis TaxID=574656 RepID=A0AAE0WJN1_9PEZI|nr:hypothetical protein LTR78_007289 [Recurvomyces mirabilis]KAK5155470.1 hypothetical protein LTS14_005731 [Recurvomyces mirabilis]